MPLYLLLMFFLYSSVSSLIAMDQEKVYKGIELDPVAYLHGNLLPTTAFPFFLEKNSIKVKGKVLDVGCGTGEVTQHLAKTATHVHALDASKRMVDYFSQQIADSKITNISTQHCCIENFFPPHLYNLVTLSSSYYWLANPNQAMKHIYDSLEQGGEFFANIETVSQNPVVNIAVVQDMLNTVPLLNSALSFMGISAMSSLPEKTSLKELLEKTGFTVLKCEEQVFDCYMTKEEFKLMVQSTLQNIPAIRYLPALMFNSLYNTFVNRCLAKMPKVNNVQHLYKYFTTIVHAVKK